MLYTRHNEVPKLSTRAGKVEAIHFNHVHTGLKRIHSQLRYPIPTLKHLDLILQEDAWIVVDRVLNDIPIVCWTNFEVDHRESLHEPIKCEVFFFHYAATMIMNQTLEAMDMMLGEELSVIDDNDDEEDVSSADVLPFRKDDS